MHPWAFRRPRGVKWRLPSGRLSLVRLWAAAGYLVAAPFTNGWGPMLRGMTALFGPSRSQVREIAVAFLDELQRGSAGEYVPCDAVLRDFEGLRRRNGWPFVPADVLLRELDLLGCPSMRTVKVPWLGRPSPDGVTADCASVGAQLPPALPVAARAPRREPRERRERNSCANSATALKCLSDLQERLAQGEVIPSQVQLAEDWSVSAGTVSDWLKSWERVGLIPPRERERTRNVLRMPQRGAAA